jgi:lipopolysaccharide transport system ATP-binding protein
LQPEVLVVDEVLAVGDSEFQQKCIGKIHDVASQGRTVLFVTHNMPIMLKLCTNAVMLEHGCVTGHGCVQSIVHQYLTNRWRPQSSISDLSQLKRPIDCLRRAQLRTCRLTATGDDEPWSLPYGAAIEFEVTVRVECHLPSLELGIAISNSTGVEIASLLSTDALERVAVAPGVHEFRVHVSTLRLTPGSYRIGFGLRAGRGMEDYLPEAVHFEVQHTPDSARLNVQSRRGAVVPDFECSLAAVISPDPAF